MTAPFIYFGGKSRAAHLVWSRFGVVRNYVEPFFGSGAVLLNRPDGWTGSETVNDLDGFIANFWRSVKAAPDEVARHADWTVNENDLFARHLGLVAGASSLTEKLHCDPEFYDARIAGWWCWGINCWIGGGWCSGKGPWRIDGGGDERKLVKGDGGRGVNRQRVDLGNSGRGVNRKIVHLGNAGRGVNSGSGAAGLHAWMDSLAARLARVRVCCGDWERVCGPAVTTKHGMTAVFLDPPYADTAKRARGLYRKDSESVAHRVREWAIANGDDPLMRIALCGYEGEHVMPADWECAKWKANGGYGSKNKDNQNAKKERIWFSPNCLSP